jgi:predicted DNA-binding transcriptional regulator AlpA
VAKTSPSKQLAAQVAFAKAKTSAIAPDLIEANEQELAEAVLTDSNRLAREHYERRVDAARGPARLGVHLLSKREVLAIANVSYPTLWSWMRQGKFPRSRAVGGKSMWVSTEIEAWMAALPRCRLKGDGPPEAHDRDNPRNAAALRAKRDRDQRDEPYEVIPTSS